MYPFVVLVGLVAFGIKVVEVSLRASRGGVPTGIVIRGNRAERLRRILIRKDGDCHDEHDVVWK